ncbi:MAG: pentapeptide repeat-containing protein [Anaerolineae bacterium]|nr:MAG: pentapeptide repeat-containing protein [Anaerolineae bacterium]
MFSSASSLRGADLTGANLDSVNLTDVDVRLATFSLPLPAGVDPDVVIQNVVTQRRSSIFSIVLESKGLHAPRLVGAPWHHVAADPSTAGLLRRLYATYANVNGVSPMPAEFSPDGRFFVFVDVNFEYGGVGFTVIDIGPNSQQDVLIEARPANFTAWHPNSNLIAYDDLGDRKSHLWDLAAKREVQMPEGRFLTWL